jgi:hypothetical protein
MTEAWKERFLQKVERGESCWLWTGSINHKGYGTFHVARKTRGAHRVSYEMFVGPIPDGLEIDHLCRVRTCVNPDHLEAVTHHENLMRSEGITAQAARQQQCVNGHSFTPENIYQPPKGGRECLICKRARKNVARDRRRLLARQAANSRKQVGA